jgi:GTP-binding protein
VEGATAQDSHIGGLIDGAGKGALVAVNKWDLIAKDTHTADQFERVIRSGLQFLDYAPMLFMSALTGQRARKVLEMAMEIDEARHVRIPTSELNRFAAEVQVRHNPPSRGGRRLKIRYVTQASVAPPTFVFFVNDRELVHFSYERYLENQLRLLWPFEGTPVRLVFRAREDRREAGS